MIEVKPNIEYEDFAKVDLRVGIIEHAEPHPNGDRLLVLKVDFGLLGKRTICAGIRKFYDGELHLLIGKRFVFCVNLAPRMLRGVESNGMILAAASDDHSKLVPLFVGEGRHDGVKSAFAGGETVG